MNNDTVEVKTEQKDPRSIDWVKVAAMAFDAGQFARAEAAAEIAQAIAIEKLAVFGIWNGLATK